LYFSAQIADDRTALARGLRRRDPELLDGLIEQYQYRLFRYLLYLTSSPETAEDLFQETWIRVLDRGDQYDGRSKFETWLFAIARHLTIDLHRRKTPQSLDALTGNDEFPGADPSPLDLFAQQEVQAGMQELLARLPAVYREVLLLRFQEDLGLEEIAAVVGSPLSTVKSRLYRGLGELRGMLEGRKA
jgi:RNA polymerase sigma-70 factor (ECF subfamily)